MPLILYLRCIIFSTQSSHSHTNCLLQGNWEYTATKHGLRGFMKTVRRSSWEQGIRINYVAPCWIKSAIRTAEYEKWLIDRGVEFGEQIDVAGCMLRISTDKSINGKTSISLGTMSFYAPTEPVTDT